MISIDLWILNISLSFVTRCSPILCRLLLRQTSINSVPTRERERLVLSIRHAFKSWAIQYIKWYNGAYTIYRAHCNNTISCQYLCKFYKGTGNLNFLAEVDLWVDSKTSIFEASCSMYNMREASSLSGDFSNYYVCMARGHRACTRCTHLWPTCHVHTCT